jgi:hypothetical protein
MRRPDFFCDRIGRMIRIAITPAAYSAITATLAVGTMLLSRSAPRMVARISGSILASWRAQGAAWPRESYSDVIIRLAKGDGGG